MLMGEFKWEPESIDSKKNLNSRKIIITHVGDKGEGKTTGAMGWPGKIQDLCFDNKSMRVHDGMYENTPRITVHNVLKGMKNRDLNLHTSECANVIRYAIFLLSEIENRGGTDWVLFDASDKMTKILEMSMRYKVHLNPFEGVRERGNWNLRNFDLTRIINWGRQISRYGVICTSYRDIVEVEDKGKAKSVYKPMWTNIIKEETDIHIESEEKQYRDRNGKLRTKFLYTVVSSKVPKLLQTGEEIDLTNTTMTEYLKRTGRIKFFNRFPELKLKKRRVDLLD
jgi:hypothetical protein